MTDAKQFSKRFICSLLAMIIFLGSFVGVAPSATVSAHEAAVISVYINDQTGGYVVGSDKEDSASKTPNGHVEWSTWGGLKYFKDKGPDSLATTLGNWQDIYGGTREDVFSKLIIPSKKDGSVATAESFTATKATEISGAGGMLLAWPAADNSIPLLSAVSDLFGTSEADATPDDVRRASEVAQTLGTSLNQLTTIASNSYALGTNGYNDKIQATIGASLMMTPWGNETITNGFIRIDNLGSNGEYTFFYGTDPTKSKESVSASSATDGTIENSLSWMPHADNNGNLLVYVDKKVNGQFESYTKEELLKMGTVWAMPKHVNGLTVPGDAQYLSIHQLAAYANFIYATSGKTAALSATNQKVGVFKGMIYDVFSSIINGVIELLGLYKMDELIFNEGYRGTAAFNHGLMSANWWNVVIKYFTIFQILAWIFLTLALAKQLAVLNIHSFANSGQRSNFMQLLVKFFAVGGCLLLCIPITRFMLDINNALVQIFAAAYAGDMATIPQTTNILASLAMTLAFFVITFYTNFIYIMRSITLAILIAMGPFFIVMMAFSDKNDMFTKWLKEVSANIFLQAFHAFAFSFLFEAIVAGGGVIERLVVIFAIMPLTDFFRGMIFGDAGSFAVSTGKQIGGVASTALKSMARAGASVAAGGAAYGINRYMGEDAGQEAGAGAGGRAGAGAGGYGGGRAPAGGPGSIPGTAGGGGAQLAGALQTALRRQGVDDQGNLTGGNKGLATALAGGTAAMGAMAGAVSGLGAAIEGVAVGDAQKSRMGAETFGRNVGAQMASGAAGIAVGGSMAASKIQDNRSIKSSNPNSNLGHTSMSGGRATTTWNSAAGSIETNGNGETSLRFKQGGEQEIALNDVTRGMTDEEFNAFNRANFGGRLTRDMSTMNSDGSGNASFALSGVTQAKNGSFVARNIDMGASLTSRADNYNGARIVNKNMVQTNRLNEEIESHRRRDVINAAFKNSEHEKDASRMMRQVTTNVHGALGNQSANRY